MLITVRAHGVGRAEEGVNCDLEGEARSNGTLITPADGPQMGPGLDRSRSLPIN